MFTSDNNKNLQTAYVYLIISIALAAAGAVYEHFSFGVYSYFMIYAFAIPLIGGALTFMLRYMHSGKRADAASLAIKTPSNNISAYNEVLKSDTLTSDWIWHAGIATLTVGSIVQGILAISGRPNSLTIIYLIAGAILLACAAILMVKEKRTGKSRRDTVVYTAE